MAKVAWHVLRVGTYLIAGMKILVTGANGFIGRAMLARLRAQPDVQAVGCVRTPTAHTGPLGPAGAPKAQSLLGWRPPITTDEALRRIIDAMVPQ